MNPLVPRVRCCERLVAVGALLLVAACPGLDAFVVDAPPAFAPGEPTRIVARSTVGAALGGVADTVARVTGRLAVAVRAPAGWRVAGRYRVEGREHELTPAPIVAGVAARNEPARLPASGAFAWHGFVTYLHTGLAAREPIEASLELHPPSGETRGSAEIRVTAGPAPGYPSWRRPLAEGRTFVLSRRRATE